MTLPRNNERAAWPVERLWCGPVEYKREPKTKGRWTSYFVSTTDGLLLGRIYSVVNAKRRLDWFADGWTPATNDKTFGPFKTRWEGMESLLGIEARGLWPDDSLITGADSSH